MVQTLISAILWAFQEIYKFKLTIKDVLILEASTDKKFSQHLSKCHLTTYHLIMHNKIINSLSDGKLCLPRQHSGRKFCEIHRQSIERVNDSRIES